MLFDDGVIWLHCGFFTVAWIDTLHADIFSILPYFTETVQTAS